MSFGNASWKYLVSILLLAGCQSESSDITLYNAYKAYEGKVNFCLSQTKGVPISIEKEIWLHSLNEKQLKEILIYFSRSALDNCSAHEKSHFVNLLNHETISSKKIIREWMKFDTPLKPPKNIDIDNLNRTMENISSPFNPIEAYDRISQYNEVITPR